MEKPYKHYLIDYAKLIFLPVFLVFISNTVQKQYFHIFYYKVSTKLNEKLK